MFRCLLEKGIRPLTFNANQCVRWARGQIENFVQRYPALFELASEDSKRILSKPFVNKDTIIEWCCPKGPDHIWTSTLLQRLRSFNRTHSVTCVFCVGSRVSVTNSLATTYPNIASEWHPELNGNLTPKMVTFGSGKRVYFQCPVSPSHVYRMRIVDRTVNGVLCPFCNNSAVCETNNISITHPHLVSEWNTERNGLLKPSNILGSYSGKVWWRCKANPEHEWIAQVNLRARGHRNCPMCNGPRINRSTLSKQFPLLASEWDYELNNTSLCLPNASTPSHDEHDEHEAINTLIQSSTCHLSPENVSPYNETKVHWKCKHGVMWEQRITHRRQAILRNCHHCKLCEAELRADKKTVQLEPKADYVSIK